MTQPWGPPKIVLDALDGVPAFEESATLRLCVQLVGRRLGSTIVVPDSSRRRTSLSSLLMAVLEYANGLQVLGSVVTLLEGNTLHAERVQTAIAAAEVPLFAPDDWARLMSLLNGLEVPDLVEVYQEVMHYRAEPPPHHCTEPWLSVVHAATLNARPGQPLPCVLLVERFTRFAKGQQQQDLLDWVAEHRVRPAAYRNASAGTAAPAAAATAPAGQGRTDPDRRPPVPSGEGVWQPETCLLFRLRPLPDPEYDDQRLLSYWWQLGGPDPYPVRGGDERIHLRDLPDHVQSLVEQAETGWAYFCKEDLTLEFLVSRDLLGLPVETWAKKGFQGVNGTLGEDHPVVLRSLERAERTDTHGRWARRWDSLVHGHAGPVHWFQENQRSHLHLSPLPAVAVLSRPPRRNTHDSPGTDELAEALRAGVPIVLWDRAGHRGQESDQMFRQKLDELMTSHGPLRLPDVLRSLRISEKDGDPTVENPSTLGHRVALLWDDPYRLPAGG
ncbi:effector-associated domain 2-containing protein [Streptomyces phaeochromogenes]|uniref:VMAP-C domain-containing protein n=1 Tax=Streptomyces phaeochromogenes TaxID=1923 RepID=UPI00340176E8